MEVRYDPDATEHVSPTAAQAAANNGWDERVAKQEQGERLFPLVCAHTQHCFLDATVLQQYTFGFSLNQNFTFVVKLFPLARVLERHQRNTEGLQRCYRPPKVQ